MSNAECSKPAMMASEAFRLATGYAACLGLADRFGPLTGIEALGVVGAAFPDAYERIISALENGEITPETYCDAMMELVDAFRPIRGAKRGLRIIQGDL
jgi:hypothetical protein